MSQRRGFTMLEVILAGAILTSLTVIALQMMRNVTVQRRGLADRRAAVQAADNVMEHLFALPWNDLTQQRVGELDFAALPGSGRNVQVSIQSVVQPSPGRRINVEVQWPSRVTDEPLSTQITAWRFQSATSYTSSTQENQEGPDAP